MLVITLSPAVREALQRRGLRLQMCAYHVKYPVYDKCCADSACIPAHAGQCGNQIGTEFWKTVTAAMCMLA